MEARSGQGNDRIRSDLADNLHDRDRVRWYFWTGGGMDSLNGNNQVLLQLFDTQRNKIESFKFKLCTAGAIAMFLLSVSVPTKSGFNVNSVSKYLSGITALSLVGFAFGSCQELGRQWAGRNMVTRAKNDLLSRTLEVGVNSTVYDYAQGLASRQPQLPAREYQEEYQEEYRSLPAREQIDANFEEIEPEEEPQQVLSLKASDRSGHRDSTAAKLEKAFANYGLDLEWKGSIVGPTFIRHRLLPDRSVVVDDIFRRQKDIGRAMGLEKAPIISIDREFIAVDFPRPDRKTVSFEDYISYNPQHALPVKVAIGVDLDGKLIEADLSDPDNCHALWGGMTGSGKTESLKSAAYSVCARHTPDIAQLILIDPKRTKFKAFENCPNLYKPIIKDAEIGIKAMEDLVDEMEERYQIFEEAGCGNIDEYIAATQTAMPRILVFFDEFADFMSDPTDKKVFELNIKRLSAKARESGIHLFLATQRPEKSVVTPLIRDNLPARIALKVKSEGNSRIIFGDSNTSAIDLLGKGDLFYSGGGEILRLQSLLVSNFYFGKALIATTPTVKSTHELIEDAWLED